MHIQEQLGEPQDYHTWTLNPRLQNPKWAHLLEQHPELSASILFLWNVGVLRDFVRTTLGENLALVSGDDLVGLYSTLLSQRDELLIESEQMGLKDRSLGACIAREFLNLLCNDDCNPDDTHGDRNCIFAYGRTLNELRIPQLQELQRTQEYYALQHISENKLYTLIHDSISRIAYMTIFKTQKGYFGLAPGPIRAGDEITLCSGLETPLAIRANDEYYNIVCSVHVEGVMEGEAWVRLTRDDLREIPFV
jgi:hypothetical protein